VKRDKALEIELMNENISDHREPEACPECGSTAPPIRKNYAGEKYCICPECRYENMTVVY